MSYSHITSDPNAEGSIFLSLGSKSEEKMAKNTTQQRQLYNREKVLNFLSFQKVKLLIYIVSLDRGKFQQREIFISYNFDDCGL